MIKNLGRLTPCKRLVQFISLCSWRTFQSKIHVSCFFSGAPAVQKAVKRSLILIYDREGNSWVDFLMVIMASGIARGRVHTTATTIESRNMAAILQVGWQRHAALLYPVLLWYWTSMSWSIETCQNKISADQYQVTLSGSILQLI